MADRIRRVRLPILALVTCMGRRKRERERGREWVCERERDLLIVIAPYCAVVF